MEISIVDAKSASEAGRSTHESADEFACRAASLLALEGAGALSRYDAHPAPLYAIDADGHLIYFNDACVGITGRTPDLGIDRWCVSAAIFTPAGDPVDYATGPMATAVREARPLRDLEAVIQRPDGGLVRVRAFPTPAVAEDGSVVGAVNLIVPLDGVLHRTLLSTAQRCRTLAKWIGDRQANDSLVQMARDCDRQAHVLAPGEPDVARN